MYYENVVFYVIFNFCLQPVIISRFNLDMR